MDDVAFRALVVVVIAAVALFAAFVARRGRSIRRRAFEPVGIDPGLHLFTSSSCVSCDRARAALVESGHSFVEHSFEREEGILRANQVARVPAIALAAEDGTSWIAEGVPSVRTVDRWLGP